MARQIKALTFDVFGTVVNWRTSIESALASSISSSHSPQAQALLTNPSWAATFATEWRTSYFAFTRAFRPGIDPWVDIDAHNHASLVTLLDKHGLGGDVSVFTPQETVELSRAWHRLAPWPDAVEGIRMLRTGGGGGGGGGGKGYHVATLTNGNRALVQDLDSFGRLGFGPPIPHTDTKPETETKAEVYTPSTSHLFSAEDFGAYKPDPSLYQGACARLGLTPDQVAMVAAHLSDLQAARDCGMRTVYVEREGEEQWEEMEERYREAKGVEGSGRKGWVDIWIGKGEGGFVELARRLGISS